MGRLVSPELYMLEIENRVYTSKMYVDLIVLDTSDSRRTAKDIYFVHGTSVSEQQADWMLSNLNELKVGSLYRAEGNRKEVPHAVTQVMSHGPRKYESFITKQDELYDVLITSKSINPDLKERSEWQKAEDIRLRRGGEPTFAPPELVLAEDGDIDTQLYLALMDRYQTPMLDDPEWKSYILAECRRKQYIKPLETRCYGMENPLEAALLQISTNQLRTLITEGIKSYWLPFAELEDDHTESILDQCENLDDYLTHFATDLGNCIQRNSDIRFDPTRGDRFSPAFSEVNLQANEGGITGLYPPQASTVMAGVETLKDSNYVFYICEMG